jgi:hypothetical protein
MGALTLHFDVLPSLAQAVKSGGGVFQALLVLGTGDVNSSSVTARGLLAEDNIAGWCLPRLPIRG